MAAGRAGMGRRATIGMRLPPQAPEASPGTRASEEGLMARGTSTGFADDTEEAVWTVTPSQNVYSYFMFVTPTEMKKEGASFTWDTLMAAVLVLVNFLMQGLLLYTIFNKIVLGNIRWQNGIVKLNSEDWAIFSKQGPGCNLGGSLCFVENHTYSCAPPSVQLTGRWHELDTNGDGFWTREEVMANREALQCKYIADPIEVFEVFTNFLKHREHVIWLHPDIKEDRAIALPYFNYAAGDIIMCGYRNEHMCSNLLQRGFFHAPLKYHTAPRVGKTIQTALEYCHNLLTEGGMCERTLPSTYSVWKIESVAQCKDPKFTKFVYTHPGTGTRKSLLSVDYQAVQQYVRSQSFLFQLYQGILIALWSLSMLVELRDVTMIFTWVLRFPRADMFGEDAVKQYYDADGDTRYIIQGVTVGHRLCVGLVTLARLLLTSVLLFVGVSYLLRQTDYVDLIMDAVTLVFIVQIAQILYAQVLRQEIREQCEALDPMTVPMFGFRWLNERQAVVDMIQLVGIMVFTFIVMQNWYTNTVAPLVDALECTCLNSGERCHEADRFSYDFWHKYWKTDVPLVFQAVAKMRQEYEQNHQRSNNGMSPSTKQALLQTANHAARNLFKRENLQHLGLVP